MSTKSDTISFRAKSVFIYRYTVGGTVTHSSNSNCEYWIKQTRTLFPSNIFIFIFIGIIVLRYIHKNTLKPLNMVKKKKKNAIHIDTAIQRYSDTFSGVSAAWIFLTHCQTDKHTFAPSPPANAIQITRQMICLCASSVHDFSFIFFSFVINSSAEYTI